VVEELYRELISPSGKYKAIITEKQDRYELDVFTLAEDFEPEMGVVYGEYWSRKNTTPIFIDKGFRAEHIAIQELRGLMSEPQKPLTIEWIRDFSFCKDATFIVPQGISIFDEYLDTTTNEKRVSQIEAKTIINFAGLFLVEEVENENEWLMGQMDSQGSIRCWGYYVSIKEAIIGL